jgi:uncharacterized protein YlxW (UPF0749 family)
MTDPAAWLLGREPPHDYDRREPTRWRAPWSPRWTSALTAVGALLVGFLLASGLSAGREAAIAQSERKDELILLIGERQAHAAELDAQLESLRGRVIEAEEAAVAGLPALQSELGDLEVAAGVKELRGPGVLVRLEDGLGPCPQQPADCRIQDIDLQLAVNTLFGVGAEAVAIDGERVMATTAIRSAGQTILVNHRVMSSPYELSAIGDPATLLPALEESQVVEDFAIWSRDFGLSLALEPVDEIVVSAHGGSLGMTSSVPEASGVAPPLEGVQVR